MNPCQMHPEYKGYEAPFTNCEACLVAWVTRNSLAYIKAEDAIAIRDAQEIDRT
jgi:hypothetical protein